MWLSNREKLLCHRGGFEEAERFAANDDVMLSLERG
jgi:hypothetical protein